MEDHTGDQVDPIVGFFSGCFPPDIRCVNFICHRGNVFVSRPAGKSRRRAADGHNGQSWLKVNYAEERNLESYDEARAVYKEFYLYLKNFIL